jgi:hypothetical protein
MNKLNHIDLVRHNRALARAVTSTNTPPQGGVRAPAQLVASVRLIGKTVILALEVAEIVGFGLALL